MSTTAEAIAQAVIQAYLDLPGGQCRPETGAWTVLAGLVVVGEAEGQGEDEEADMRPSPPLPIVLATGVKCLPPSQIGARREDRESVVRDSHAEVLVRRGLRAWVTTELRGEGTRQSVYFRRRCRDGEARWERTQGWSLAMYISMIPCGDASMQAGSGGLDLASAAAAAGEASRGRASAPPGASRTKPAKGQAERTECMSCSDKLALWNLVGWQGAGLSLLLDEPLRVERIIVSGRRWPSEPSSYDPLEDLERALIRRVPSAPQITLELATREFPWSREWAGAGATPSHRALSWIANASPAVEVLVDGIRQGSARWRKRSPATMDPESKLTVTTTARTPSPASLSRLSTSRLYAALHPLLPTSSSPSSVKRLALAYAAHKAAALAAPPFSGSWIRRSMNGEGEGV